MNKRFRVLVTLILCIMFTNVTVFAKGTETTAKVTLNKVDVYLDLKDINATSLTYQNVTYIPLRKLADTLGVKVDYDKNTETIKLTSGSDVIMPDGGTNGSAKTKTADLKLNSVDIYVDGELIQSDNIIYNGTTYLPLRAISEAMGVSVNYDSRFEAVYLTSPEVKVFDDKTEGVKVVEDTNNTNNTNNTTQVEVDDTTVYKPLLTKEDINYPAEPKSEEDFEKVMLYMANNNLDTIELTYRGTVKKLFKDSTVIYDNLATAFQNTSDEYVDLLSGVSQFNFSARDKNGKVVVTIKLSGTRYKTEDLITGQLKFEEEAQKINEELHENGTLNDDMTDKEIARALYTYVTRTLEYDMEALENMDNPLADQEAYTGYGAVMNKKAVCQGYTALYNYLLKLNGIECYGQSGEIIDGGPHIWTVAILDGEKTYIDVTYGDPVPDRKGYTSYKYFDISKEALSKDRTGVE